MTNLDGIKFEHSSKGLTADNLVELWHGAGWNGYSDKYPRRLLEAMQRSDYIVVAWDGDKPVGLCACMSNSFQAYVTHLCVTKRYQYYGIGSKLIGCVKQYYDDCQLMLMTRQAKTFYLKNGFNVDETVPMYIDGRK